MSAYYYPIHINLQGSMVLVIGGGQVAQRKIKSLLSTGAQIRVVSPQVTDQIKQWIEMRAVTWLEAEYDESQLEQGELVFAATDQSEVNLQISEAAKRLKRWVNVAERAELGTFIVPSTIRRGKLVISVTTSGASPTTTRTIRAELEQTYGEEYEMFLDVLSELRMMVKQQISNAALRQQFFKRLAEVDWITVIRTNQLDTVKANFIVEMKEMIG